MTTALILTSVYAVGSTAPLGGGPTRTASGEPSENRRLAGGGVCCDIDDAAAEDWTHRPFIAIDDDSPNGIPQSRPRAPWNRLSSASGPASHLGRADPTSA